MPNWVFNKVRFIGDEKEIARLKHFVTSKDSEFDFDNILPMPEDLNLISGSDESLATACYRASKKGETTCQEYENHRKFRDNKTFEEWASLGKKYYDNVEKYGASTWYDWHCNNWGTKWNASEPIWSGDNFVSFDTAWSMPEGIYRKLMELFPKVTFEVDFADEDLGNNCGQACYNDGEPGNYWVDYNESLEFACEVWGYDYDEIMAEREEEVTI